MRSALTIFCGKGGVGKTTLALAHGIQAAQDGLRVLMVTSHPLHELALSVSLGGLRSRSPEVDQRLFIIYIDPYQVLESLLRSRLPSKMMADRILASTLYRTFVEVVPGLKEFAFLRRMKELAERRRGDGGDAYDLLVWDAPATGHFVQTLKVAGSFDTYFSGPLASEARSIHEFMLKADLEVIPIALLEEMSVDETAELVSELREIGFSPVGILCNLVTPMLRQQWQGLEVELGEKGSSSPFIDFLRDRFETEGLQLKRISAATGCEAVPVPRLERGESDLELLFRLSEQLPGFSSLSRRRRRA